MFRKPKRFLRSVLLWFGIAILVYGLTVSVIYFGLDCGLSVGARTLLSEGKSLLSNVIASFILYFLVVYLPAGRKRAILRASCKKMYLSTKKEILFDILSGSRKGGRKDIQITDGLEDALMEPAAFAKFFRDGREADEGFHAFSNYIQGDEQAFRSIIFKLKLVARQLEFVLNNVDFDDDETFQKLKWLEEFLFALDDLHADYDNVKSLNRAIWPIFSGWSNVDGYLGFDLIEKAIDEI